MKFAANLMIVCCGLALSNSAEDKATREVDRAAIKVENDRRERIEKARSGSLRAPKVDDEQKFEALKSISNLSAITLPEALKIASTYNRSYANERDANTQAGLSYLRARHLFDPRLSGGVSMLVNGGRDTGVDTSGGSLATKSDLGVDLVTEFGTRLRLGAQTGYSRDLKTGHEEHGSSVSFDIAQPLLRGAGRTLNREPLTAAERSMLYQLRRFEIFRQSFCIETTSRFFNLLREKQVIANNKQRFEQSDFLFRRATSLNKIGRARPLDVLQAEQERLQTENNLRDAEELHKDSLLLFKTFLGLPDHLAVDIRTDESPVLKPVAIDPDFAIELAYLNRLDLTSAEEQLEDARRGLKITRNSLLPDLNIVAGARTNALSGNFSGQVFDNHTYNAGVNFSFPLDRVNEKIAVRQAEIGVDQQERGLTLFRDQIAADVRRRLRDLIRIEKSMEIQKRIVDAATRRLANAEVLFRQGTRTSRDVVEAQQDLLNARNTDIQFLVDHVIAELQFRQALGVLTVDPQGQPVDVDLGQKNPRRQLLK